MQIAFMGMNLSRSMRKEKYICLSKITGSQTGRDWKGTLEAVWSNSVHKQGYPEQVTLAFGDLQG